MIVKLNPGEMAVAHHIAALRRYANQSSGVFDQRRDINQPAIVLDILGAISELAFAKAIGMYPDFSISPRSGGSDCVINGTKIDIKSTLHPHGRLLATITKKIEDADIYVLAVVQENIVRFAGWAEATELINRSAVTDLGYGLTYALSQNKLHPMNMVNDDRVSHAAEVRGQASPAGQESRCAPALSAP